MGTESDPFEGIRRIAERAKRVRLAPGVIGKSSMLMLGAIGAWLLVLWRLSPDNLFFDGLLIVGASIATYAAMRECRKMREFATENPSLALMEGADITEFQRFVAESKGGGKADASVLTVDPSAPKSGTNLKHCPRE